MAKDLVTIFVSDFNVITEIKVDNGGTNQLVCDHNSRYGPPNPYEMT